MSSKKPEAIIKYLRKKIKVMDKDGIEQRKIIEQLTRLIKIWELAVPKQFCTLAFDIINEYERRFTLLGDKLKPEHPVFTYEKGQEPRTSGRLTKGR